MTPILKIKILSDTPEAFPLPAYQSKGAAGIDLYACLQAPLILEPHKPALVPTGVAISLPTEEYVALIFARSGLATRYGVSLSNGVGVVDSDYRGEIKVGLINLSDIPYTVQPGDRIAQLVVTPVCHARIHPVIELDATERGDGGFGSTGK
jgi:dUTP pyrophosphatase